MISIWKHILIYGLAALGNGKWFGCVLGLNGKIFGIPGDGGRVLIVDPTANTYDTKSIMASGGGWKWFGGVLGRA